MDNYIRRPKFMLKLLKCGSHFCMTCATGVFLKKQVVNVLLGFTVNLLALMLSDQLSAQHLEARRTMFNICPECFIRQSVIGRYIPDFNVRENLMKVHMVVYLSFGSPKQLVIYQAVVSRFLCSQRS